jgi:NAD+ kinase
MKHFVVIANAYKDRNFALTNKIVTYIEQKGGTAKGLMSNVEAISDNEFELEDIPQDTQCILVLGGDGTLIRAATRVETLEIPLMGVNLGTLGYLCEVEEATVFDAIDSLMADKYMTEDRIMLTGHKRGSETSRVALNDIVHYLLMHALVTDHALFTYLFPACLKLWLDKTNHLATVL